MESFNSSSACSNVTYTQEFTHSLPGREVGKGLALAIICVGLPLSFFGYFLAFDRRKHYPMNTRRFSFITLHLVGVVASMLSIPMRDAVDRDRYPCALLYIMHLIWGPLSFGPVFLRGIFVMTKLQLQDEIKDLKPLISERNLFPDSPHEKFQSLEMPHDDEFQLNTRPFHLDSAEYREQWNRIKFLRKKSGSMATAISLGIVFLLDFIVLSIYIPEILSKSSCVGCAIPDSIDPYVLVLTSLSALAVLWTLWTGRSISIVDSTGIWRDYKRVCLVMTIVTIVYLPLSVTEKGIMVQREYYFSWFNFAAIANVYAFLLSSLLPAVQSIRFELQLKQQSENMLLVDFLAIEEGYAAYEQFCASELSLENLKFYIEALGWKEQYYSIWFDHTNPKGFAKIGARLLFNEYLAPNAPCLVSLSHEVFQGVRDKIMDRTQTVPRNHFDAAIDEVYNLMVMDTWARFTTTKAFRRILFRHKALSNKQPL